MKLCVLQLGRAFVVAFVLKPGKEPSSSLFIRSRSQLKRDDPLNLSILLRGGKETNKDSPSNGE
jgi:hypothetical protein